MVVVLSSVPLSTLGSSNVPSTSLTLTATPASARSSVGVRAERAGQHLAVEAHPARLRGLLAVEAAVRDGAGAT